MKVLLLSVNKLSVLVVYIHSAIISFGLAFSGGRDRGISSAGAWNALANIYPSIISRNLTLSTVSGGSIGYGFRGQMPTKGCTSLLTKET